MYDFKRRYDGTGRVPRAVQETFFDWLGEALLEVDCAAAQMPVGSGKSLCARTIQLAAGAAVVTPSNVLIDQYTTTYPQANFLKGKDHYICQGGPGLTCSDWINFYEQRACDNCPYQQCRDRAEHEPTFFNPLSLYYFNLRTERREKLIVVDEAHQLPGMVQLLAQKRFPRSVYKFDGQCQSEIYLAKWMSEQIANLAKLSSIYANLYQSSKRPRERKGAQDKIQEIAGEMESIALTLECLKDDPQNYAIYFEEGYYKRRRDTFLHVRPIRPPAKIMRRLLYCDKLILLSGTLLPTDIEDLTPGRTVKFLDLPSPIPKERRPIFYRPTPFPINVRTEPALLTAEIEKHLDANPHLNTIVHTTYDRAQKMAPFFKRPILVNTPETKNDVLEQFKRHGGVFLAAGCAEGLDLKDDLCRLNIIPHLMTPNISDPVIRKRRALEDGERWIGLETLKILIQQAGRSTRHEKDFSKTIVMDPRFPSLMERYGQYCPKSFTEAIEWKL